MLSIGARGMPLETQDEVSERERRARARNEDLMQLEESVQIESNMREESLSRGREQANDLISRAGGTGSLRAALERSAILFAHISHGSVPPVVPIYMEAGGIYHIRFYTHNLDCNPNNTIVFTDFDNSVEHVYDWNSNNDLDFDYTFSLDNVNVRVFTHPVSEETRRRQNESPLTIYDVPESWELVSEVNISVTLE